MALSSDLSKVKFFGAALEPSDSDEKVSIKVAYVNALLCGNAPSPNFLDPYEALVHQLSDIFQNQGCVKIGKLDVETWLTPKPNPQDLPFITSCNYRTFIDSNCCDDYTRLLEKFVERKILPDVPAMIGVDHSLTGGSLRALSKKNRPEETSVLVLDGHCDAIAPKVRMEVAKWAKETGRMSLLQSPRFDSDIPDTYNFGSFLRYLIQDGSILPERLAFVGVSDYPTESLRNVRDHRVENYLESYLSLGRAGVRFIPKGGSSERFLESLDELLDEIETPWIYLSFDVDIGGCSAIWAARMLDAIGVDESTIYEIAKRVNRRIIKGQFKLAGFDVMEIDVHLLGAESSRAKVKDNTAHVVSNYIRYLLGAK